MDLTIERIETDRAAGLLCRDVHSCRGPETFHWNNLGDGRTGELFCYDCLEPAHHAGWCRSEILHDDISTHRIYWPGPPAPGEPDEYDITIVRSSAPSNHRDGRPFDPAQGVLFELAPLERPSAEDLVVFVFDFSADGSRLFRPDAIEAAATETGGLRTLPA